MSEVKVNPQLRVYRQSCDDFFNNNCNIALMVMMMLGGPHLRIKAAAADASCREKPPLFISAWTSAQRRASGKGG